MFGGRIGAESGWGKMELYVLTIIPPQEAIILR